MGRTRREAGLDARLARLEEVYAATDMSVEEYDAKRRAITREYLDAPEDRGLIGNAVHGDRVAMVRLAVYVGATLLVLIIAAIVLGVVFAPAEYLGGDT